MDTKQFISVEIKKGEFTFVFNMPYGASWGNAIDASYELLQEIHKMSRQAGEQLKHAQEQVEPVLTGAGE